MKSLSEYIIESSTGVDAELAAGKKLASPHFKKARPYSMKSAVVWNWECPTLLSGIEVKGKEPHFLQIKVECQEFEKDIIESTYEYRLLVQINSKNGKECKNPNGVNYVSSTFDMTDKITDMWEKILGMVHAAAKSEESFKKLIQIMWEDGKPTVFRLDDNLIKSIS